MDGNLQASIMIWNRDSHFTWSMLVKGPRGPFICRIDSVLWRKYKSQAGAITAAERTAARLGLTITAVRADSSSQG